MNNWWIMLNWNWITHGDHQGNHVNTRGCPISTHLYSQMAPISRLTSLITNRESRFTEFPAQTNLISRGKLTRNLVTAQGDRQIKFFQLWLRTSKHSGIQICLCCLFHNFQWILFHSVFGCHFKVLLFFLLYFAI